MVCWSVLNAVACAMLLTCTLFVSSCWSALYQLDTVKVGSLKSLAREHMLTHLRTLSATTAATPHHLTTSPNRHLKHILAVIPHDYVCICVFVSSSGTSTTGIGRVLDFSHGRPDSDRKPNTVVHQTSTREHAESSSSNWAADLTVVRSPRPG